MANSDAVFLNLSRSARQAFRYSIDVCWWAADNLGATIYDNQIEIVNGVCDLDLKYLAILQSRGGGKTYSVAVGLIKACLDYPRLQVGVFGPKADQATRLLKEITQRIIRPGLPIYDQIDWSATTTARVRFLNGSEILALSAADTTQNEGNHFHIVVCDEVHRISEESMNSRIVPMLGSLGVGKIIKLGIPVGKGQWWTNCNSPNSPYKVLKRDWTQCTNLLKSGSFFYGGRELPTYVADQMPLSMKIKMFPDRPDLHTDGSLTEVQFNVNYAMTWMEDIDCLLSDQDHHRLLESTHDVLTIGRKETRETYYFGLDAASGSFLSNNADRDYTALSIWRLGTGGVKEKVKCYEWREEPYTDQLAEIRAIIHPTQGIFPCKFGVADYSNTGIAIVDTFAKERVPIKGVIFQHTEPTTGKNFKNAMFNHFVLELQNGHGRVKYPREESTSADRVMDKALTEWANLQRRTGTGNNDKIEAPAGFHDDHCCADVMAIWAMDKAETFDAVSPRYADLPKPVIGVASVTSRGVVLPNMNQQRSPFLPRGCYNPAPRESGPGIFGKPMGQ